MTDDESIYRDIAKVIPICNNKTEYQISISKRTKWKLIIITKILYKISYSSYFSDNLAQTTPKISLRKGDNCEKIKVSQLRKLERKTESYAKRLKKALKLSENVMFQRAIRKFTTLAALFTLMQFREIGMSVLFIISYFLYSFFLFTRLLRSKKRRVMWCVIN